jgi:hypothetical protein
MSRTGTVNPPGAFRSVASCESERCVFAMHTGIRPVAGGTCAERDGEPPHRLDLIVAVVGETVHGHDGVEPERLHDAEVAPQVRGATLDRLHAAIRD